MLFLYSCSQQLSLSYSSQMLLFLHSTDGSLALLPKAFIMTLCDNIKDIYTHIYDLKFVDTDLSCSILCDQLFSLSRV